MSEYADGYDDGRGEKFDELMVEIVALREQLKKVNKDRLESHIRWDAENAARMQAEAKIATLRQQLAEKEDTGTTHYVNCFGSGPKHYVCALMEITDLRKQLQTETQLLVDGNKIASRGHREEVAALREQLAKEQSEYICTCGIRVTPHRCPTNNGF